MDECFVFGGGRDAAPILRVNGEQRYNWTDAVGFRIPAGLLTPGMAYPARVSGVASCGAKSNSRYEIKLFVLANFGGASHCAIRYFYADSNNPEGKWNLLFDNYVTASWSGAYKPSEENILNIGNFYANNIYGIRWTIAEMEAAVLEIFEAEQ